MRGPESTAVDQATGDLFIADRNNFRIVKFDSEGNFLLAWGYGVADGVTPQLQTCGPAAIPPSNRCFAPNFSVENSAGNVIPEGVAVDQASGDVYVADVIKHRITKFTSSGKFVYLVGKNVNVTKVALGGGATQAEKNICTATSGDTCTAGESGTGQNEFTSPRSLAIAPTGEVWIGDASRLVAFNSNGTPAPVAELVLPGAGDTRSLAIDSSGDFYVKSESFPGIRKLEAVSGALLETLDPSGLPVSVTIDEEDNVYVGDRTSPYRFLVFNSAGEQVSQFGAGQVIGGPGAFAGSNAISVDGTGVLYAASSRSTPPESVVQAFPIPEPGPVIENQHVEDLLPTSATLAADLNPEGNATTYHFEYGIDDSYGQSTPELTLPGSDFDEEAVFAELAGLTPETTYHFRLVATNNCNPAEPAEECTTEGPDTTFTTRSVVGIEEQWASNIAANSAVLHAELDPLGVAADWWIEYGTSTAYGSLTPEVPLAAGFGAVHSSALLSGLTPGITYHYRFVARDERGGVVYLAHGDNRSFTTQIGGLGLELADDRAWEIVSPPNKFGGRVGAPFDGEGHLQAAADGDGLAYLTLGSIEADPDGNRATENSSVLARRGGGGNWSSKDITPPHTDVTPIALGNGREYKLFSTDLSTGLLEPRDTTPLSPEASERTPYLRENGEPPSYTPLVTCKEGFRNIPLPCPEFGGEPEGFAGNVGIHGATPDLEHAVLGSTVALLPGVAKGSLYEWEAGQQLQPASVLPSDEGGAVVAAEFGSGEAFARRAISDDGSRIFWSTINSGSPVGLYLRDMEREETLRLDVVQPGSFGIGAANPVFQGANAAGTVAFFTDSHQLTADASEEGRDLYRCEIVLEGEELACELEDVSSTPGENAEVQGLTAGMSDDATRIYFVAKGVLDTEPNDEGESAISGQPNLYLWEEDAGVRFIATLASADSPDWGAPEFHAFEQSAAASPSGRYLAFMSQRSLTGYDNRDAISEERAQEVFQYDAVTDQLVCTSCNPSGARPQSLRPGQELSLEFDPQELWSGVKVAALLPEATKIRKGGPSLYRPRAVHDNGRLFFNAADSLVPADSNSNGDVYQYEPTGTGSCTASSGGAGVVRSAGGCVALISSGTGEGTSAFLDASVGGDDVFFYSRAQLSVTDEDGAMDVYDARVGGVPATLSPRAECLGEACQPPAIAPDDPTPASRTFDGPGNLREKPPKPCRKGKHRVTRKGKSRCVANKNKKRKRHQRRANRDGGARR